MNSLILSLAFLFFSPEEKIKVATTLTDLRSIAQEIGRDRIQVINLCAGKQDPHFVEPKPTFLLTLSKADLFIINGFDLEIAWVPPLLDGARNPKIIKGAPGYLDISKFITPIEIPSANTTRAEGDVHPFGNPHYLFDPLNGKRAAVAIANKLKELDPQNATHYEKNLSEFSRRLDESLFGKELVQAAGGEKLERATEQGELDAFLKNTQLESKLGGWMGQMKSWKGTKVVPFHKNLSYFLKRFGLEALDYIEPKPGIAPSTEHFGQLVIKMQKEKVKWILTHDFYDRTVPSIVSSQTGARILVLPSAVESVSQARDYFSFFDSMIGSFSAP